MAKKKVKKKPAKKKSKNAKVVHLNPDPKNTINTAIEAVKEYAIQLKGRADEGKIRGALIVEFGVDPKDGGIRQAGAVSVQEAALAAMLIQKMILDRNPD